MCSVVVSTLVLAQRGGLRKVEAELVDTGHGQSKKDEKDRL